MVKKIKRAAEQATATAANLLDSQLASSVKDSAQHIWLAGMGAFSKAQEGGTKMFETLMKEGVNLQKRTQGIAEDKINEVTGKMSAMAGTVTSKAGQNWDKLEAIFEQRTAKAMNKLGVPTAKDVAALVKRVDELAVAVAKMSKGAAPAKAAKSVNAAERATKGATKSATKGATTGAAKVVKRAKAVVAASPFAKAPAKRTRKAA
jgi:poly(hydroxyalkanoate) granule-associated protein